LLQAHIGLEAFLILDGHVCPKLIVDWMPFSPWLTCLSQAHIGLEAFSHHDWRVYPRLMSDWRPFTPWLTRLAQAHSRLEAFHTLTDTFVPGSRWTVCVSHHVWHICPRLTPEWRPFSPRRTCLSQAYAGLEAFLFSYCQKLENLNNVIIYSSLRLLVKVAPHSV